MKNIIAGAVALLGILGVVGCSAGTETEPGPVAADSVAVTEVPGVEKPADGTQTTFITSPDAANMSRADIEATVQKEYRARGLSSEVETASGDLQPKMAAGGDWCGYAILSCGPGCAQSFYCCGGSIRICWSSPS